MTHEEADRPSQAFDPFEQELRRFFTDEAAEPAPE